MMDCSGASKMLLGGVGEGEAWSCVSDAVTGCLVKASKNCGAKLCYEGKCLFESEIPAAEPVEPDEDAGSGLTAPADASSGGCLMSHERGGSIGESTLTILATLLGFILAMMICRRRGQARRSRPSDSNSEAAG